MMPPTRGHDLKPAGAVAPGVHKEDAPHTGARLETKLFAMMLLLISLMPPTRGHDLKQVRASTHPNRLQMPPTRGHDLKLMAAINESMKQEMPPTRGHDLKHLSAPSTSAIS